ncbi:Protein C54G7.1 [Aphelenchoides avenae]|nr:Protein C54G7.1 [Aphelenchus avenae]
MNGMQTLMEESSSEWAVNLATPLQSLFHKADQENIRPRMEMACQYHDLFLLCLSRCYKSAARRALVLGQSAWNSLCQAFRSNQEFSSQILPCWAQYGDLLSSKCHVHALMVQNSILDLRQNGLHNLGSTLDDLCRAVTIYDRCYIGQTDQHCGEAAWRFLLKLNTKSST